MKDRINAASANLDNSKSPFRKGEFTVDSAVSLINFVDIWLSTFKKNTVKASSYNRLLISKNALEKYDICRKPIGEIDFFDIQGTA